MSDVEYIHLPAGSEFPVVVPTARKVIVLVEHEVEADWQAEVSRKIIESGCLYMMAWGQDCSSWDDSVDMALLEKFEFKDIPDEHHVWTSWHNDEPMKEVFWFSNHCARHDKVELSLTTILHIAAEPDRDGLLQKYKESK